MLLKEWRLHLTAAYLAPPLILAVLLWELCLGSQRPFFLPQLGELVQIFEIFWPLALCIGLATILPFERQQGMLELRLSYPRPYWLSLLQKVALPVSWWVLAGGLGLYYSHRCYLAFPLWDMLCIILPPAIALAGFTLFVGALTLNTTATVLSAFGWWGLELATGCRLSGLAALFPVATGRADIDFTWNRFLLLGLGLLLAAATVCLLRWRRLPTVED